MTALGRLRRFNGAPARGRNRRIFTVPAGSGKGLLTEPTDGVSRRPRHASMMSAGPLSAGSCTRLLFKAAIRSMTGAGVEISRGFTGSPFRALLIRGGVR